MPKRTVAAISIIAVFALILFGVSVGAQQECPSPRLIDEITGRGAQQSPPFDTTTNLFRISYQTQVDTPDATFIVRAEPTSDPTLTASVADIYTKGAETGETFGNAPPGRYFLDINTTGSVSYTIKIEECGEGQATPKEGTQTQGATQAKSSTHPKSTTTPVQPPPPPPAQPKAAPVQPQPVPPAPAFNAGGPKRGPVPRMPDGTCPAEYSRLSGNSCFK